MNDHRRALILAAEAIDFGLPDDERTLLADHVRTCTDCRYGADLMRAQALVLQDRPRAEPPSARRDHLEEIWTTSAPRLESGGTLRLVLLAIALVLAVIGLAVAGAGSRQPIDAIVAPTLPASPPDEPTLPAIGTVSVMHVPTGSIVNTRECSVVIESGCATDVIGAFDSVWTTSTDSIARVDPVSGTVTAYIAVDGIPVRMVEADGSLWATIGGPGTLVRIDPATNTVTASVEVASLPGGVARGAGSLWVADQVQRSLVRVDPGTASVTAAIDLPVSPWDVAADDGAIWVTDRAGETLVEIDPTTNKVVASYPVPGGRPHNAWDYGDGVTIFGERILIASGQQVSAFDPATQTFSAVLAPGFSHLATGSNALFLVANGTRRLQRLDPATLSPIASQDVQIPPPRSAADWEASIAVVGDSLWIRSYLDETLIRVFIDSPPPTPAGSQALRWHLAGVAERQTQRT